MGGTTNMASPFRTSTKLLSDKEQNAVSLKAFSDRVARWHIFKQNWVKLMTLVYFMAIWSIVMPSGIFCGQLVYFLVKCIYIFPRFGMLFQDKSGNPVLGRPFVRPSNYSKLKTSFLRSRCPRSRPIKLILFCRHAYVVKATMKPA
jgi:hypothetical protein